MFLISVEGCWLLFRGEGRYLDDEEREGWWLDDEEDEEEDERGDGEGEEREN